MMETFHRVPPPPTTAPSDPREDGPQYILKTRIIELQTSFRL